MSLKQDYITRIIDEAIKILIKRLFKINDDKYYDLLDENQEFKNEYEKLKQLVDQYKINEAENILFSYNIDKEEKMKIAILMYRYINSKDEEFLKNSNYTREEILEGIKDISKECGYENITSIIFI